MVFIIVESILIGCPVYSQQKYEKRRHELHIEKLDTSIVLHAYAVNPKILTDEEAAYAWYADNKVLETMGSFSGKLLDGKFESFYGNGNLREMGYYENGRKTGKWVRWHRDGRVNEILYWNRGLKHGRYFLYNDQGQRMLKARFRNGKLHGMLISYDKDQVLSKTKYKRGKEIMPKLIKNKPANKEKKGGAPFWKKLFKKGSDSGTPPAKEKKKSAKSQAFHAVQSRSTC